METYTLPYVKQITSGNLLYDSGSSNWSSVTTQRGGMWWELRGKFKTEGTYVYLQLIHVDVWQKPTQHYKAIILQLKINIKKKPDQYCLRLWVLPQLGKIRLRFYTLKEILVSLIFLFNVINLFTQPAIPCHYFMRLNFHC